MVSNTMNYVTEIRSLTRSIKSSIKGIDNSNLLLQAMEFIRNESVFILQHENILLQLFEAINTLAMDLIANNSIEINQWSSVVDSFCNIQIFLKTFAEENLRILLDQLWKKVNSSRKLHIIALAVQIVEVHETFCPALLIKKIFESADMTDGRFKTQIFLRFHLKRLCGLSRGSVEIKLLSKSSYALFLETEEAFSFIPIHNETILKNQQFLNNFFNHSATNMDDFAKLCVSSQTDHVFLIPIIRKQYLPKRLELIEMCANDLSVTIFEALGNKNADEFGILNLLGSVAEIARHSVTGLDKLCLNVFPQLKVLIDSKNCDVHFKIQMLRFMSEIIISTAIDTSRFEAKFIGERAVKLLKTDLPIIICDDLLKTLHTCLILSEYRQNGWTNGICHWIVQSLDVLPNKDILNQATIIFAKFAKLSDVLFLVHELLNRISVTNNHNVFKLTTAVQLLGTLLSRVTIQDEIRSRVVLQMETTCVWIVVPFAKLALANTLTYCNGNPEVCHRESQSAMELNLFSLLTISTKELSKTVKHNIPIKFGIHITDKIENSPLKLEDLCNLFKNGFLQDKGIEYFEAVISSTQGVANFFTTVFENLNGKWPAKFEVDAINWILKTIEFSKTNSVYLSALAALLYCSSAIDNLNLCAELIKQPLKVDNIQNLDLACKVLFNVLKKFPHLKSKFSKSALNDIVSVLIYGIHLESVEILIRFCGSLEMF